MNNPVPSFPTKKKSKQCKNHCNHNHFPNNETVRILTETEKGKNLVEYDTMDDFWKSLGYSI